MTRHDFFLDVVVNVFVDVIVDVGGELSEIIRQTRTRTTTGTRLSRTSGAL